MHAQTDCETMGECEEVDQEALDRAIERAKSSIPANDAGSRRFETSGSGTTLPTTKDSVDTAKSDSANDDVGRSDSSNDDIGSSESRNPGPGGQVQQETVQLTNPIASNDLSKLFNKIINEILILAIPIIVFFIIYAGFLYVTARGDVTQVQTATRALTYAIVGGLIILGAKVLIEVIKGTISQF